MAKTKPNIHAQAKKTVATNAIFKKVNQVNPRENGRNTKDVVKKTTQGSKSKKGSKHKHGAKHSLEHTLAAEFADSIQQSRETIEEGAIAALNATYLAVSQRLVDSHDFFKQREQDELKFGDTIANPLNEQELEWTSMDGKQSGKTTLGVRMKKFQKTIEAEEKEFERHFDEWTSVQAEFRHLASLIVGPDGLDNLLAGNFDRESFVDAERIEMMEEIKAEQEAFMEQIEEIGLRALEAMTESEKQLDLKQKKDAESFLAILRGED